MNVYQHRDGEFRLKKIFLLLGNEIIETPFKLISPREVITTKENSVTLYKKTASHLLAGNL